MCTPTNRPETESNPNPNQKRHAVVSIQLNVVSNVLRIQRNSQETVILHTVFTSFCCHRISTYWNCVRRTNQIRRTTTASRARVSCNRYRYSQWQHQAAFLHCHTHYTYTHTENQQHYTLCVKHAACLNCSICNLDMGLFYQKILVIKLTVIIIITQFLYAIWNMSTEDQNQIW